MPNFRFALWPSIVLFLVGACDSGGGGDDSPTVEDAAERLSAQWMETQVGLLSADGMEGRNNLTAGGERAREFLKGLMESIGLQPAGEDGWEQPFAEGVNLIGRYPGADPDLADEVVIVSGHYDHLGRLGDPGNQCRRSAQSPPEDIVCNGAADNAAGTITALAVARALIEAEVPLRRAVGVILWDAEEDGLRGSYHFTDEAPLFPLHRVAAMFSVDNVGTTVIPGVAASFAVGVEYSDDLRAMVKEVNGRSGYSMFPVSSFFVGSDTGGRSDHLPFRLKGIPILFFGSGSPPQYHTTADEIGIVDFGKLEGIARHVLYSVADLADRTDRPGFVAQPVPSLDDASALIELGEAVLADPEALGLDASLVSVLEGWMDRLNGYLEEPPTTEAGWTEYEEFLKSIISTVYLVIGGGETGHRH